MRSASASARSIAPGSSGLGKLTVGKSGSGSACSPTSLGRGEAGRGEHRPDHRGAHPVHRGVHHGQVPGRVGTHQGGHRRHVVGDQRLVQYLVVRRQRDRPGGGDGPDRRLDLGVHRRHDLRPVEGVDLVAVVLRRVVRGGDHHAGHRAQVPDREGQHRGGQQPGQQPGVEAGGGQHARRVGGEGPRAVPAVVADHHDAAGPSGRAELGGQARRGPADHGGVHAVRAGPQRTAQAGGAEGQWPGEPVGQLGLGVLVAVLARCSATAAARRRSPGRDRRRSSRRPGGTARCSSQPLPGSFGHLVDAEGRLGERPADQQVAGTRFATRRPVGPVPAGVVERLVAQCRAGVAATTTGPGWPTRPRPARNRAGRCAGRRPPAARSRPGTARWPSSGRPAGCRRRCRSAGRRPACRTGRRSSGPAPHRRPCSPRTGCPAGAGCRRAARSRSAGRGVKPAAWLDEA